MLKLRIIPTILKRSAVVVKGKNFSKTRVIGPLLPILRLYQSREIDELIILDVSPDLDTNKSNRFNWLHEVTAFATMPLAVGGGINSIEQASDIISMGADKLVLNRALRNSPSLISQIANKHGSQSIVLSIDAVCINEQFFCYDSWLNKSTDVSVIDAIKLAEDLGVGEIFLTSYDNEGTKKGFDKKLINHIKKYIKLPLIIHGGAYCKKDFLDVITFSHQHCIEINGLAAGSCFHFSSLTPAEVSIYLSSFDIPVRVV